MGKWNVKNKRTSSSEDVAALNKSHKTRKTTVEENEVLTKYGLEKYIKR